MSRNLCKTECNFCGGVVDSSEAPRPITKREAGVYFGEYRGMLVANAECVDCAAKYLAWIDRIPHRPMGDEKTIRDLSFRSTFNDEHGPDDVPTYRIELRRVRVGPWGG